jgi:ABC-type antimicrobial peptide transport system permease subunit
MLKNYFKIAWRNLFRNKLHTLINIGGLIIGFAIGIIILLVVYNQFSYDKFHANKKKLYQAYMVFHKKTGDEISGAFGYPAATAFKEEAGAIDKATRYLYGGNKVVYQEKELDVPVMLVDADFLSMFTFPVSKGNKTNPLQNLSDIVITEDAAKKIFGNEEPIGKTVKLALGNQLHALTVAAVVKNTPQNSTLRFDMLARIENRSDYVTDKNNWDNQHHQVYVQLKEGATRLQAEEQLRAVNQKYLPAWSDDLKKEGALPDKQGDVFNTHLMSFDEVHFAPRINGGATNKVEIYTVLAVGLFIILIACFNFININLATAFTRSKEIGMRKCLGAIKAKLFAQLWIESFLVCLISFLFSLALVNILLHSLKTMMNLNLALLPTMGQPGYMLLSVGLLLFVSLIAGGYPSWLMSRFSVVETLKGKVALKRKSVLRDSLIVMQFVIACIMISCTFIIYRQFKHLQQADLGINKDYIVSVPLHNGAKGKEMVEKLRARLASDPHILSITGSNINLGRGLDGATTKISIGFKYKNKEVSSSIAYVDYDYLKTFGVKLIEGRDFDKTFATDTVDNVLLSETAAKQFREKDLVGKNVGEEGAKPWHVVGIFSDFHLYSMREQLQPLTLMMNKSADINYCFIKLTPQNLLASMETIKKEMVLLEPGKDFRGSFVDENINNWYKQEQTMSLMFSIAAIIAIILSCTGLLAMVLLITQQRTKEIGVRKVLGATVQNISVLISKDFLRLVFIAVLIASPISWLMMNKWLQSFPYRTEMQWWMVALVALTAFMIALMTIATNTLRVAMRNPVNSLRTE